MEKKLEVKYFTYSQNNSGGSFVKDDKKGICEYVIIEALNAEHANTRAEDIGLYFDGCNNGNDCPCCGDRWYSVDDSDGYEVPSIYDEPIETQTKSWYRENCFIHYLDGKFKKITFKEEIN